MRQLIYASAAATSTSIILFANRDRLVTPLAAETRELKKTFGAIGFRTLELDSVQQINHNTKRFRFALPEGDDAVSGLGLTSALLSMSWPTGRWTPVFRPYTPVSDLDVPGHLDFTIKHYPGGKQSTHLHSLRLGDSMTFFGKPLPGFNWTPNKHSHVMLIAGGAGITPIYQLAKGILNNPEDKTKVTVVWGANTDADVFMKDEFDEMARKHPGRFDAHYTVSTPEAGSSFHAGRVTNDYLKDIMAGSSFQAAKDGKVFLCGPPAMEKALVGTWTQTGILTELGFGKDRVHRF